MNALRQLRPTQKYIKDMEPGDAGWAVPWALSRYSKWGYEGDYLDPAYTVDTEDPLPESTLTVWVRRTAAGWTAATPERVAETTGFMGDWSPLTTLEEVLEQQTSIPVSVSYYPASLRGASA